MSSCAEAAPTSVVAYAKAIATTSRRRNRALALHMIALEKIKNKRLASLNDIAE